MALGLWLKNGGGSEERNPYLTSCWEAHPKGIAGTPHAHRGGHCTESTSQPLSPVGTARALGAHFSVEDLSSRAIQELSQRHTELVITGGACSQARPADSRAELAAPCPPSVMPGGLPSARPGSSMTPRCPTSGVPHTIPPLKKKTTLFPFITHTI